MPGISVTTGVRVGPTGADVAPGSTLFIAGTAERGPLNEARLILGMSQFEAVYGEFTSGTTLWSNVKTFFEEGGTRCYVARTAGGNSPTLAKATVNIVDASAGICVVLTAANEGTWANTGAGTEGLKAVVTVAAGAVSLSILYKNVTVWSGGPFSNETLINGSTKYAKQSIVEAINSAPALAELVTASVGASILTPTAGTYSLVNGVDNTSSATATHFATALSLFDYDFGAGAVAIPGQSGATIWDALRTHAKANRRIALCASAQSADSATAIGDADGYWGNTAATREDGSYMAWYWPWVEVPDGFGSVRAQSPEAYVAAARARAHQQTGAWRVGAGEISTARFVTGLYAVDSNGSRVAVTKALGDTLDANRVNALRIVNGSVRVYGARSVSADETNWRFITYRDTLNYVTMQAETALEPLVFSPIDGRGGLFGRVEATLTGLMEPIRIAGGVFEGVDATTGRVVDRGYSIEVSATNNPASQLAQGIVSAIVGVRVSPVADKYSITITKSTLTANV
jgi:hypothetical protein